MKRSKPTSVVDRNQRVAKSAGMSVFQRRGLVACMIVVLVVGAVLWWRSQSQVQLSDSGYELTKALFAACNLEDANRLVAVETEFKRYRLSAEETETLTMIFSLARQRQWQAASLETRKLMEAQEQT